MSYIINTVKLKNDKDLILRKATTEDAEKIIEYLNLVGGESDNLLFGKDEIKISIDQEKSIIKAANSSNNNLMLLGIIDDIIVSVSNIFVPNRKRIVHNSEIAISVRKDYWNQGIGTAVMSELINFAESNNIIKNITLGVNATNFNAIKLYENFGFVKIGCHKNYFNINGCYFDEILMDKQL